METDCTRDDARVNGLPPLPAGTRLLHIGPHKTGTTSIQGALFAARDRLPEHGVEFPARTRHPMEAALAACARPAMMGDATPTERHWTRLLRQVDATGRRTSVVSSEFFADAEDDATVARIVEQLGGERVHVLVTLRPLARIMPSQWQQYVQNGLRMGYQDWLEHMLRKAPYDKPNPSFWRRHRHDRLVERWARAVGPERVTVVVVDDSDRGGLLRTFETLLGLPAGLLQPVPDAANRSLTLAETEMLRNLNKEFRGNGLPDELYSTLVRNGAVMHMKNACSPAPDDVRISTPGWALESAARIGARTADRITGLGVRVLGDPALLSAVPPEPARQPPAEPRVAPEVAAQALYGVLAAAAAAPVRHTAEAKARTVHQTASRELVKVLGHRCLKKLRRR
ncbi:hypothetical protein ELQ87_26375 [Streptomyces griseoviridis]|uniref:Sulfotransferase family protein n=1 Tax=Streptomyces griseoviridis TaxID=45398 RepID=A0A3Q9KW24_STRGD|nr:hypothetical protein [Streptomyces griseoviridis]AZS87359.1 hypothetical protein ELQ87_26375 [Streptomyces griseoviridis]QCN85793.1 hypothetical protein DDJ31_12890 [Streptomyces griseoviridis]